MTPRGVSLTLKTGSKLVELIREVGRTCHHVVHERRDVIVQRLAVKVHL